MKKANLTTLEMKMDYDDAAELAVKRAKEKRGEADKGRE